MPGDLGQHCGEADRYDEILALANMPIPDEPWPQIDQGLAAPWHWLG